MELIFKNTEILKSFKGFGITCKLLKETANSNKTNQYFVTILEDDMPELETDMFDFEDYYDAEDLFNKITRDVIEMTIIEVDLEEDL